jgi:hypothetical protein
MNPTQERHGAMQSVPFSRLWLMAGIGPEQANKNCVLPQHCLQKMENETALDFRLRGSVVRRTALGGNGIFIQLPWMPKDFGLLFPGKPD